MERTVALSSLVALGLLVPACGSVNRRPLIAFDSTPAPRPRPKLPEPDAARPETITLGPASRPLVLDPTKPETALVATVSVTRDEIARLVAALEKGKRSNRRAVLDRLVALGEAARAELEGAAEEATFETDLLHEALARIDEARRERPEPPDRKRPATAPWIEAKYRLALDRFLAGDDLGAQALVEAILLLEPASPARPRLERLRRQIRDRLIADTILAVAVVPEEAVLVPGKALRGKLRLENRTRDEIVLRPGPGSPLGTVVVDYEELQPDGTRTLRRASRSVRTSGPELRLGPGKQADLDLDLPTVHEGKTGGVVGRYRIGGRLRPYTFLAGEEPLPYFLPIPLLEVVVVDPDDLPAAGTPGEAFEAALRTAAAARERGRDADWERAARRAFVAALVWASAARDDATAAIVKELERAEGRVVPVLCAALARAVGEPGSYSKDEWLRWWRSGQSRPAARALATDPEDDEPAGPGKPPR